MTDWVTITIAAGGAKVRRRAASIDAYGPLPSGLTFVEVGGRAISVRETVDAIAQKLQDTDKGYLMNHAAVVSPSDGANLPAGSGSLSFVNTGGTQTLHITTVGGEDVSIILPSGMWPIRATRVWSTGTTVTSIVCYWT